MESLKNLVDIYIKKYPEEFTSFEILEFLKTDNCFSKDNQNGHFTGSAWIISPDKSQILMTHHRKLGMWLQLGGHCDGETDLLKVALREAKEESGIKFFNVLSNEIFDIDIHQIPRSKNDVAHKHYDVRFLFEADPENSEIIISEESYDVSWVPINEVPMLNPEVSICRMLKKTLDLKIV